jgi:hypothetical protein
VNLASRKASSIRAFPIDFRELYNYVTHNPRILRVYPRTSA